MHGPNGHPLYQQQKSQFDSHTFVAPESGAYAVCFSNEFSTFSHKVVYMDFQVGEEKPLPSVGEHITVMTLVSCDTSCSYFKKFRKNLNHIVIVKGKSGAFEKVDLKENKSEIITVFQKWRHQSLFTFTSWKIIIMFPTQNLLKFLSLNKLI